MTNGASCCAVAADCGRGMPPNACRGADSIIGRCTRQVRFDVGERSVLVIAGTDSSCGAGLLRDVAVLRQLGVRSTAAVTAVTAQSNAQVTAIHHVPPAVIAAQIRAALEGDDIGVVKIGMLGTRTTVCAV